MKQTASISLDLDNAWSYLQVHGNPAWSEYPSYLEKVVPIFLDQMADRRLRTTVFIVGKDAAEAKNADLLRGIAEADHEIGNHSFNHLPWFHRYQPQELRDELDQAHSAIASATGVIPQGFRGPGFSISEPALEILTDLGYSYDASTLPTFIGPLARAYYFRSADLSSEDREIRNRLFGRFSDVLRPNQAYQWQDHPLTELPVTTLPLLRTPFHLSYLIWLGGISMKLADLYLSLALAACRATKTTPSVLIHPLDFFGGDDAPDLTFFPGMEQSGTQKRALTNHFLDRLTDAYEFTTCSEHIATLNPTRTVAF